MDNKRRLFLKGVLSSSAGCMLLGGSGLVHAAMNFNGEAGLANQSFNTMPIMLLTSDVKVEDCFGAGVKAALPNSTEFSSVRTNYIDVVTQFNKLIKTGRKVRLVGMVDDATGELLIAQARRVGARISWLGQHTSNVSTSRHQVINNQHTQGSLLSLSKQLNKSSSDFELQAEQPFSMVSNLKESYKNTGIVSSNARTDQWASHLGYALTVPTTKINSALLTERSEHLEGQFLSFVIEV
ncbi:MAG: hypothetical protein QNK36_11460 [Colwellia sp.]|nr:hypothetical protein [Colwellia sp.]